MIAPEHKAQDLARRITAARILWYNRASFGDAIAFSWTATPTFTFSSFAGRIAFIAVPVLIVASNNFPNCSPPTRFRHRLKLDGPTGNSCCTYERPRKNCQ